MTVARLAGGPAGAALVAAVALGAGLWLVADPGILHDEGLLMYGFARLLGEEPLPLLFLQKSKPALALLYAAPARLGPLAYQVAHVAVAAAGVALLHRAAAALGLRRPWVPALLLALSPMYLWSAASGVANSDGVAGTALALYLLATRHMLLAGVVLGALPWIRFEAGLFSAVMAAFVLLRDRPSLPRFLGGLLAWPVAYALLGALYHRDLLWMAHYPPNIAELDTTNPEWVAEYARHGARSLARAALIASPALVLVAGLRLRSLQPLERAVAAFAAVYYGLFAVTHLWVLPLGPAFVLGYSVRYAMVPVAMGALLAGRAVEAIEDARGLPARDPAAVALLAAAGVALALAGGGTVLLIATAALLVVYLGAAAARPAVGALAVAALAFAGPALVRDQMLEEGFGPDKAVAALIGPLEARLRARPAPVVYTNVQELPTWLARTGRLPGVPVRYMVSADQQFELETLSNPAVGQTAAVLPGVVRAAYGEVVVRDELRPDAVPEGALFALSGDRRTRLILPADVWDPVLREIGGSDGGRLYVKR